MMENEAEFDKWLSSELGKLSLDDESVVEYVGSIVKMDDSTDEEKKESVLEFLESATDVSVPPTLMDEIVAKWSATHTHAEHTVTTTFFDAATSPAATDVLASRQAGAAAVPAATEKAPVKTELELEALAKTRAVVAARYMYEDTDDEGKGGGNGGGGGGDDADLMRNSNRERVRDVLQAERRQQKEASAAKANQDKEARAKEKARQEMLKEKRKQACVKGERKR